MRPGGFRRRLGAEGTTAGAGLDGAGTVKSSLQWGHFPFLPANSSLTLTTFLQCGHRNLIAMIVGVRCRGDRPGEGIHRPARGLRLRGARASRRPRAGRSRSACQNALSV